MSETIDAKIHFEVSTIETIDQSVLNFVKGLSLKPFPPHKINTVRFFLKLEIFINFILH